MLLSRYLIETNGQLGPNFRAGFPVEKQKAELYRHQYTFDGYLTIFFNFNKYLTFYPFFEAFLTIKRHLGTLKLRSNHFEKRIILCKITKSIKNLPSWVKISQGKQCQVCRTVPAFLLETKLSSQFSTFFTRLASFSSPCFQIKTNSSNKSFKIWVKIDSLKNIWTSKVTAHFNFVSLISNSEQYFWVKELLLHFH